MLVRDYDRCDALFAVGYNRILQNARLVVTRDEHRDFHAGELSDMQLALTKITSINVNMNERIMYETMPVTLPSNPVFWREEETGDPRGNPRGHGRTCTF